MPEPVTAAVAIAGFSILTGLQRHNTSVSESGYYLRAQTSEYQDYARKPYSLDARRHVALSELSELVSDCNEQGWDDKQAPAITPLTVHNVEAFLLALPSDIPDPDFSPEPDNGAISLEWYGGYRKIASVSIHESDRLAFGSLQGTDVTNGAYRFGEDHIPSAVIIAIREIIS